MNKEVSSPRVSAPASPKRMLPWRQRQRPHPETSSVVESLWQHGERWVSRTSKVSLAAGTLIALFYFLRIRNMPLDSLSSMAGLAAAIALAALGAFAVMTVLWGTPSFVFWGGVEFAPQILPWFLKVGQRDPAAIEVSRDVAWSRTLLWCTATIGVPWSVLFVWTTPGLFGGPIAVRPIVSVIVAWSLFEVCRFTRGVEQAAKTESTVESRGAKWKLRGISSVIAVLYSFFSGYALLVFLPLVRLSRFANDSEPVHVLLFFFLTIGAVVGINALTIAFMVLGRGRALFSSIAPLGVIVVSLVLLVTALAAWGSLQDEVMTLVSVRVPSTDIVLGKSGCQSLERLGIKAPVPATAASDAGDYCTLRDVTVLSRVGTRWPIDCAEGQAALVSRMVLVRDEDVISLAPVTESDASAPGVSINSVRLCELRPSGATRTGAPSSQH